MRRCLALLLVLVAVAQATVDPCKRQPFRGRCPSVEGAPPKRSQFVLRYYSRNGECVSYPYGHCASDSSEPQLYRYKEECEDACITPPPANLGSPKDGFDQTYGTVAPAKEIPTVAEVEERAESTTPSTTLPVEVVPTTAVPRTDCERRRAAAASSKIRGGFVPVCKGNGDFEPLQCELDGRQCFCVDQSGIEIANSRTHNGVKPDCAKIEAAVRPRVQECSGDFERGPCASHMERWHYVEAEQKCKQFSYSGCGGNGNNYETERDCMGRCAPLNAPPKCAKGEPLQSKQGSIINCAKTDCPSGYKCNVGQQTSVCCPDTEKTIGLQQSTTVGDVCKLDKERGPCDKYELRFYFNAETKECKYFFWGGCEGNGNNFETIESCESTCGIAKNRGTTRHPTPRTTQGFRINQNGERTESTTPTATTSTSAPTTRQHVQTTTTRATPRTTRRPTTTSIDITPIPADEDDVVVSNRNNNFQGHPVAPVSPSVLLEGSDLSDAAADVNRCAHPRDSGTCGGQFVRWFWDDDKKTCDVFTYSGCQGNGNNFASREECFAICHKESTPDFANVCHHDVDAGECNGVFQRFAFDSESGECRPFTYGGCGGNGNNFATIAECRSRCQATVRKPLVVATNLCDHNIDVGECTGVFVRFGFDKESNDCRQFTYGGCGGNGNNFASLLECRNVCVKKACPQVTATCDMSRCQIVEDQNGCPFCSCSPVKQPLPPVPTHCAPVNENSCHEPCLLINNRRGCQECVCPKTTQATHAPQPPPTQITQQQIFGNPPGHQTGRAPASEVVVGPPASATRVAPPSPNSIVRAHDVKTVSSQQKTSEIETSRPFLPPTLNAELNEKCLQPVEVGPCKNFVDRWFFSSEDGTCRPFKYGGCAGNRNHFFTQKECEIHCARFLQQPDDFSSEEDEDDTNFLQSVNRRRPIAAGVSQHHEAVPLPVDNYKSPDPVLRGNQPSPYDEIAAPSAIPVSAAGVSHFEPKHEEEVLNPDLSVGRDPIPTGPVGIGRNLEPLDLDGLEEPTTVIPTTKKAVAFTVAAPPAPAQINPNVHTLRTETFDAKVVCALAPETGPCTNYIQRWFFNAQSLQCEQFSFGSCGGNQNNFADRTTCELKCMSALGSVTSQVPERCSYDKDPGFGQGYNVKWYFNMKNLRCEQFVYEGQGGNSNQFETLSDCERFCTPQPKSSSAGKVSALPTTTLAPTTQTEATEAATVSTTSIPTTEAVATTKAPASHSLRPLPEQPLSVSIDENENIESINNNNNNNEDYDSSEVDEGDLLPVPTNINSQPIPPAGLPEVSKTDDVKPPAHAAKTVTQEEVEAKKSVEKKDKDNYKAEPIAAQTQESGLDNLPRVGPSPPMKVDYQTGQINPVISGIKTFPEGRIPVDKTEFDSEDGARQNLPSCPNGLQEMRYADGRPVMCLPGKNQCPDKSVCYFNGIDFFCCPNIDDPYDKHVFGGYDGEETKHGYKIFGPLRVRRLMDEVPLRTKRQTSMDRAFNTAPVSFSIDSVIAPLRFDAEKPRSISRAARMRKPTPPQHGNPMCMLPLAKGDCQEAHLRYFYDKESDSCRLFHYSGCQGNANNFGSLEDCQRLCVLSGQPTVRQTPAPVVQEEKPTAPVGQCPVGSPLGGNAPVLCGSSTDSIGCPEGYYCRAGPPDVCCPGPNPSEPKKEIRFAPEVPRAHSPRGFRNEVLTATPIFMCPDASDPLMAENGKPQVCGSGFDGMQMCPKGYYCAIDNESGSRLCCSLLGNAERIPNQQVNAPYFGRRSSNPGEVIERGSLPTDQVTEKPLPSSVPAVDFSTIDAVVDNTKTSIPSDTSSEEYEDEEEETPEHLLLKPLSRHEKLQQSAASESPKASNLESEIVNIDMPKESTTVVEEVSVPKINPMDQTICHVKPTEGRACREDEKAPKTNLQYFYSAKDNRCKLYFYRGCGGNENRFEKKADCESLCVVKL